MRQSTRICESLPVLHVTRFFVAHGNKKTASKTHLSRTFKTGIRFCLLGQIRWEESDEVLDHFFRKIASRELGKERGKVFDRLWPNAGIGCPS